MTPPAVLSPKRNPVCDVRVTACQFGPLGSNGEPLLDLNFLDREFVRRTGVRRLFIVGVRIREVGVGLRELGPFFDGSETVRLVGCRNCGRPCRPSDGVCPEWTWVECVMSS